MKNSYGRRVFYVSSTINSQNRDYSHYLVFLFLSICVYFELAFFSCGIWNNGDAFLLYCTSIKKFV